MKKSHNIFEARANILPYEYPQLLEYKDAIRHSYWIDTEFNFTEDIQDFKINLSKQERDVIKKTMLSIAQIEVSVKTFWADMYKRMPIAEVGDVGMTFAESEVRHKDAYARLIRILGLEKEFETVVDVPAIAGRIKYLTKYLDGTRSRDNKMYAKSVLLFSLFIEHVSLFSQFLIMMSFNKDKNMLKGISNVVEATSKEEDIHGNFGAEIINIIRKAKSFIDNCDSDIDKFEELSKVKITKRKISSIGEKVGLSKKIISSAEDRYDLEVSAGLEYHNEYGELVKSPGCNKNLFTLYNALNFGIYNTNLKELPEKKIEKDKKLLNHIMNLV